MKKNYILIACAMKREAQPLIKKLNNIEEKKLYGYKIYIGNLNNIDILVAISEPGLINMSSLYSLIVNNYSISKVINYGMVGGYGSKYHKLDLIIGSECINYNSYKTKTLQNGIDIYSWDLITFTDEGHDKLVVYKANESLINATKKLNYPKKVHYGRIGSGDVWNNEYEKIKMLRDKYHIICEDMEAVSIYQLSKKFKIPCISIKGISNNHYYPNETYDDSVISLLVEYIILYIQKIS